MATPPLSPHVPIVDKDGKPTPAFLRWWQSQRDVNGDIPISAADVSATLDKIGGTQGDLLYRDSSKWNVLPAGIAGRFLQTGGAGANPAWALGGSTFVGLSDTPADYTGQAGKVATVNGTEDGLEFAAGGGGGSVTQGLNLSAPSTASYGSRGGIVTPYKSCSVESLYFQIITISGTSYKASIVELSGSNEVTAIVGEVTVSGLPTTSDYDLVEFTFATPVDLIAGVKYGVLCTRLVTSGSSSWAMRGSGGNTFLVLPLADVTSYVRSTANTVTVSATYSSGNNSYWFAMKGF